MSTMTRAEAARANGAKSRGPKTAEGLAKSSKNAIAHGFTTHNTIVLDCENPTEFQEMCDEYKKTYQPENAVEQDLVDQMVGARWRIRRLWAIETALFDAEILNRPPIDRDLPGAGDAAMILASAFRSLVDDSRALALISRYEARLSRMHHRAFAALRELQLARQNKKAQNEPNEVEKAKDLCPLAVAEQAEPPAVAPPARSNVIPFPVLPIAPPIASSEHPTPQADAIASGVL